MRALICLTTAFALLAGAGRAAALGPDPLWTLGGLANPESAVWVPSQKLIYVSNVAGEATAKDGQGFISKVGPDGRLIAREWVRGLNAPKGIGFHNGLLYVADIDELLVIDTGNGRIKARHKAAGAQFLNDVAIDGRGRVYVSDMLTDTIWQLSGSSLGVFVKDAALAAPNGLLVEGDALIVGSWGEMSGEGFATRRDGYLLSVNLGTKAIEPRFAPIPFANLDGVIADDQRGYIVSDWMHGNVYKVAANGDTRLWLMLQQGSADIASGPNGSVLVPMMLNDELRAYAVE